MFYVADVQQGFAFGVGDLETWRNALLAGLSDPLPVARRSPLGQLVKSMLSSRTRDSVSQAAYKTLVARYPTARSLAAASPAAIAALVAPVTFAADKASHVAAALARIGRERPDFDLSFLADVPLVDALAWLERLPGVARKVAASTLNASTLGRPVLIVDTHVLRVLQRLGFVRPTAGYRIASEAVTEAAPWSGDDFLRFHILTKRLGQTVCRWDMPACDRCPLAATCTTAARPCEGAPPAWARQLRARMG